jgi:hypothetical protein
MESRSAMIALPLDAPNRAPISADVLAAFDFAALDLKVRLDAQSPPH